uniref:Uncharacterized protein n=1 Tax=Oncorhynchus tshawytscha TaxID=74940 RepID=A0A8C8MAV5_ONCTS
MLSLEFLKAAYLPFGSQNSRKDLLLFDSISNTPSHSFILLGVGGTWAVFDNFGGFLMSYSFV